MLYHDVDYERILQPQEDMYDVQVFKEIKKSKGYVEVEYPSSMVKFHGKVAILPTDKQSLDYLNTVDFERIADFYSRAWPLGYDSIRHLVDVYVPNIDSTTNYSGQYDGTDFEHTGAWGVMSSLVTHDPAATLANLIHELMHWKLVALGFGTKANTFFPTTQDFILNHESELCWSIVNSYADTAQPAVGNKPTDRPVSASLHAYLSFLGVAYTHSQVLKIQPNNYESQFKMKRWGERFDKCLDEIWKVGKFTPKGQRLMMGVAKWTADFYYEARQHKLHLL